MRKSRWAALIVGLVVIFGGVGTGMVFGQEVVTLTVTVETPDGDPVPDADLTATWEDGSTTATTVSNGKAFIDVKRGADVEIAVDHPDYIRNQVFTVATARERSVSITVHPRASAQVRVRDSEGPVSGVLLTFRKRGSIVQRLTTDANGVIEIGPVEAGEYQVSVRKSRYLTERVSFELEGSDTINIQIEQGTIPMTVNVTDDFFSPPRPIAGATVDIADVGSIRTQPNGIQQVSVPVNIRLTVRVSKDGYRTVEQTVGVAESPLRVQVHMRRIPSLSLELFSDRVVVGERLLVEVTDEYGAPVPNASVSLDGTPIAETGEDGQARFEISTAGTHRVTVSKAELTSSTATVNAIEASGTTTVEGTPTQTASPGLPGFGILVALLGLLVAGLWVRYHTR